MATTPIEKDKDPGLQLLAGLAGSLAGWIAAIAVANLLLRRAHAGPLTRGLAVAIAIGGFLPWVWMTARSIAAQDEFTRRMHLIALSWAFAATAVFLLAVDFLRRADFIDYVSYTTIWMFMIAAWGLSIAATQRYYR